MKRFYFFVLVCTLRATSSWAQNGAALDLSFNTSDIGYHETQWYEVAHDLAVVQPDGKIIVGLSDPNGPSISYNLFRLTADGYLDPSFALTGGPVLSSIALQSDGKILVVTRAQGLGGSSIYRLNADGTADPTFQVQGTGFDAQVDQIVLEADGDITALGTFTHVDGIERGKLARLTNTGALKMDPLMNGTPTNLQITQPRTMLLLGNEVTLVFGGNNPGVVAYDANGGCITTFPFDLRDLFGQDTTFYFSNAFPSDDGGFFVAGRVIPGYYYTCLRFDQGGFQVPSFDVRYGNSNELTQLQQLPNGNILMAGGFNRGSVGENVQGIMMVDPQGSTVSDFPTTHLVDSLDFAVRCATVFDDGRMLLSSRGYTIANGAYRSGSVMLLPNGALDTTFRPVSSANGTVRCVLTLNDGRMVIGGDFTSYNGHPARRVARILEDGTYDPLFDAGKGAGASVRALELLSDGTIAVGMNCSATRPRYDGHPAAGLVHIAANGALLNADMFAIGLGEPCLSIYDIETEPNGDLFAAGRDIVVRVNPTTGAVPSFSMYSSFNETVYATHRFPDGTYIVGGTQSEGPAFLRRVSSSGASLGLPSNYSAAGDQIRDMEPTPSGGCMVCGLFLQQFFTPQQGLIQLNATAQLTSFPSGLSPAIGLNACSRIKRLSNGTYVLTGNFDTYAGIPRNGLVRLLNTGAIDPSFDPEDGFDEPYYTDHQVLEIDQQGRYIVAGDFTSYNGVGRNRILRLVGNAIPLGLSEEDAAPDPWTAQYTGGNLFVSGLRSQQTNAMWTITDATGRVCRSVRISADEVGMAVVDVGYLSGGVYFLNSVDQVPGSLRFFVPNN